MKSMAKQSQQHWTSENISSFIHRLGFDFIVQLEKKMEALGLNQAALAQKLGVSKGAVSHVLNDPQNLTLKTIAKYARALGIKAAIVAYDDYDADGKKGFVNSEIFSACWEQAGRPYDFWALEQNKIQKATLPNFFPANVKSWFFSSASPIGVGNLIYNSQQTSGNFPAGLIVRTAGLERACLWQR